MGGAAAGKVASGRGGGGWRRPLGSGVPGLQWPPELDEGAGGGGGPAAEAVRPAEGVAARERHRPGGAGSPVGGAGGGGEEKTTRRWLGGAVAGSISVAAMEGGGGGRRSWRWRGRRSLLRLDAFQSQKAINRRPCPAARPGGSS